jgi:2-polyprenyl-3-methyl-5-hydroxy-6-metoxy-1,4-benzoquinol methylase
VKRLLRTDTFTVLDIGCGTGWISSLWKGAGAEVVGLEPSIARGEYARRKYGIKIIPAYIEELHSQDRYDVIIMRHVLEHFSDPFHVLEKAHENHDESAPDGLQKVGSLGNSVTDKQIIAVAGSG